jgi:WD40 repeat protein
MQKKKEYEDKQEEEMSKMNVLDIVKRNEEMIETEARKVSNESFNLLSYDRDFYFKNKKERNLLEYTRLDKVNSVVYGSPGKIEQSAYCLTMNEEFLFVGFAKGVIKIFDRRKEVEVKTLTSRVSKTMNRVCCMAVHPSGDFLAAGYQDKLIVIWDLKKYKVYFELDSTHDDQVDYVQFLSQESVSIISADKKGYIYKTYF